MRVRFQPGEVNAGSLKLAFGRTPSSYFRPVDAGTADYRDIYWSMDVRNQAGWTGGGGDKLSRAHVFATANWAQAAVGHVWSSGPGNNYLALDPTSGTDTAGNLRTTRYNDFANFRWLGLAQSTTPIFDSAHVGQWYTVEAHMQLNDAGLSNGLFELWINGNLEAQRTGLNWLGSYNAYGINAVFFENYWNAGSPTTQERYFDNLVVSTQRIGVGVPVPWQSRDIGDVGVAGSASYQDDTFTVRGAGADIGDTADAFRYVYQPLVGDGWIFAQVTSVENTHPEAKAGLMIRETLNANARNAGVFVTPGNGASFQRRLSPGGSTTADTVGGIAAPYGVYLERLGDYFYALGTSDYVNWDFLGEATMSIGATVYMGLAVTSHDNTALNTSAFDYVFTSMDGGGAPSGGGAPGGGDGRAALGQAFVAQALTPLASAPEPLPTVTPAGDDRIQKRHDIDMSFWRGEVSLGDPRKSLLERSERKADAGLGDLWDLDETLTAW